MARKAAFSSEDEELGSTPSIEYGEELESGSSLLLSLQLRMNCRLVEFLELEKREILGIEADTRKHSMVSLTLSLPQSFVPFEALTNDQTNVHILHGTIETKRPQSLCFS